MFSRWAGLALLLAALLIGDQIRLGRPEYKYRLSVEVDTPDGIKSASGVMSVHPNRGYGGTGSVGTRTKGDAIVVDLGNKRNLVMLLIHGKNDADGDAMNYLPMKAFADIGQKTNFRSVGRLTGSAPVKGDDIPLLVSFADANDPTSARVVKPDDLAATFGKGFGLHGVSVAVVPNGLWPLDFGGVLGEPVTRGIESKLPWLKQSGNAAAAAALTAAGVTLAPTNHPDLANPRFAFESK